MNGAVVLTSRRRPAIWYWLIVIVLAGVALTLALWPRSGDVQRRDPDRRLYVNVKRAVSGGKIKLDGRGDAVDEYVIYAGVRAPFPKEPYFEDSMTRNAELVVGKEVRLRFGKQRTDAKERMLAYVFCGDEFVNETLVREGLAYVRSTKTNDRFSKRLLKAQKEARKRRRGIWKDRVWTRESSYFGDPKYGNFHRRSCEETDRINPARLRTFKSAGRALDEGFAPCAKCKP